MAWGGNFANYHRTISTSVEEPPPTLWVEWRYRSNHPLGPIAFDDDGQMSIRYKQILDTVNLYGDAAVSLSGNDFILDLELNEFHTYRFESIDGLRYRISADGVVFIDRFGRHNIQSSRLQMRGAGGSGETRPDTVVNAWDYVHYGTIDFGEQIVATDPPAGVLPAEDFPNLERFSVTFDAANYVYVGDITVETTGGDTPAVVKTRRREGDEPDTLEIVLDRPMPAGETTRCTFDDGTTTNVVEYTLALPDADGDGVPDEEDNCPDHPNPDQADCDKDGTGDACTIAECTGDPACDDCNDNGVPDGCDLDLGGVSEDCDGDGLPDECQTDTDGDGTIDACDGCPFDPGKIEPGVCGCGQADIDSDGDTILDCNDICPGADDRVDDNGNGVPDCSEIPATSVWGLVAAALAIVVIGRRFRR